MSDIITVPGLCGEEMHAYIGYGVYVSSGTTFPPTWSLSSDTQPPEGVLMSADRGEDGLSTGERCTICLHGKVTAVLGGTVATGAPLTTNSSAEFVDAATLDGGAQAYALKTGADGQKVEIAVNFLQSNRRGSEYHVHALEFVGTTNTWTPTVASNVVSQNMTATSTTGVIHIPGPNEVTGKIKSLSLSYSVGTTTADDVTTIIYKLTNNGAGDVVSAATVTTTYDTSYDTTAERKAIEDHTYTLTVTTPFYLAANESLFATVTADVKATTVIKMYEAIWKTV